MNILFRFIECNILCRVPGVLSVRALSGSKEKGRLTGSQNRKYFSGCSALSGSNLEVHHPELAEISEAADHQFAVGHDVGEAARKLHPGGILSTRAETCLKLCRKARSLLPQRKSLFCRRASSIRGA